jgi:hypothetical protein
MKTNIATIEGCVITLDRDEAGLEEVEYTAKAAIDCDGSGGNPHHDPCFQSDTSLHHNGKALNAEQVPYIAVPPVIIQKTRGVVLGSRVLLTNTRNHKKTEAVVADIGPRRKLGELSPAAAEALGLDGNPNHGGTDAHIIQYRIFPGIPAVVNGVKYDLKSS